jgi:hypothetical protein
VLEDRHDPGRIHDCGDELQAAATVCAGCDVNVAPPRQGFLSGSTQLFALTINPRLFPEQIVYTANHAEHQYDLFDMPFGDASSNPKLFKNHR